MITSIGDNFSVLISCNHTVCDNWMAFLAWYSISKNLPDAKVLVACNRTKMQSPLFGWTKKCKVPFELHKCMTQYEQMDFVLNKNLLTTPVLQIQPFTVAVRDFEESGFDTKLLKEKMYSTESPELCCDAKEDKSCVFVTYSHGWGKFVLSSWIHNLNCPFTSENRFSNGIMNANEVRIGRLWSAVTPLFHTVSRG